jgi:hypothetical protein
MLYATMTATEDPIKRRADGTPEYTYTLEIEGDRKRYKVARLGERLRRKISAYGLFIRYQGEHVRVDAKTEICEQLGVLPMRFSGGKWVQLLDYEVVGHSARRPGFFEFIPARHQMTKIREKHPLPLHDVLLFDEAKNNVLPGQYFYRDTGLWYKVNGSREQMTGGTDCTAMVKGVSAPDDFSPTHWIYARAHDPAMVNMYG